MTGPFDHGNIIKVMRLDTLGQARLPTRAHNDDAGLDLYVSEDRIVGAGQFVDIPSAVAIELPPHCWAMLTGRSSTLRKKGLLVNQGIIDPGYRGELYAGVWNLTEEEVVVEQGERLAQLIIMENATQHKIIVEVTELGTHERGTNGFGSSGR